MIYVSGAVRRTLGERNTAALLAAPPAIVECRCCRRALYPLRDATSLSVLTVPGMLGGISAWAHRGCGGSRVVDEAAFRRDMQHDETRMTEQEQAAVARAAAGVHVQEP